MRRFVISACLMLAALTLSAQNKGDFYLSGFFNVEGGNSTTKISAGNSTTTRTTPQDVQFMLVPKFGYFIADRLEVNFSLGYSLEKTVRTGSGDDVLWTRYNQFVFGPGINYHIPLGDKFTYAPGAEILFGVGGANSDVTANTKAKLGNMFSFGLRLDLLSFEFRPTEHIGIALKAGALGYNLNQLSNKEEGVSTTVTSNDVSFGLNYSTTIGFKYYF